MQAINRVWDAIAATLEVEFSHVDTDGTDLIVSVRRGDGRETRVRVQLSQELPPPDDNVVELRGD